MVVVVDHVAGARHHHGQSALQCRQKMARRDRLLLSPIIIVINIIVVVNIVVVIFVVFAVIIFDVEIFIFLFVVRQKIWSLWTPEDVNFNFRGFQF